ncbi:ABC transporter ATP-binding protein [Jiangella mangrovi]|uniref:Peptide/nickel transport system ATP-binding protein n=1 Tax=Jiangella mangrovi TaxID=1524084 RepID=A0A7W9LNB4_9ACTN|nr:ATP-binding cassette domain-containing protein [Jiangella mangrovi]MBB5790135.1 peptide/nickel transport system ATP-binding protein [Jiangella mangrovi]
MLSLRNVSASYPGAGRPVLDGVTLDVPGGVAVGLLSPSGSGKTTLLRVAALLLAPSSGTVVIDGTELRGTRFAVPAAVRRSIGYVVQSPRSSANPRLTLRRIIAEPLSFAAGLRTPKAEAHAEQIAELADLVQLSPDLLDRLPHQVSDGQLQRACLARALAGSPRVLLCDEPTAMLDAPTTAVVMRVIARHVETGAAALIASHDRALLEATCPVRHTLGELSGAAA